MRQRGYAFLALGDGALQPAEPAQHVHHPLAVRQRLRHAVAQCIFVGGRYVDVGHRQLNIVFAEARESRPLRSGQEIAIDPEMRMSLRGSPFGKVGVIPFAVYHQRRQQADMIVSRVLHDACDDGLRALRFYRHFTIGAILRAQLHIQQTQKMINLGERGYRTLASAAAGALLNGDGGRDAGNAVHLGPRCALHKLARVGVE